MTNKSPIQALDIPVRKKSSLYPPAFASRMDGREKRQMGEFFGLTNFGINLTRLKPNATSSLRHSHSKQDEFIYILQGHPTLITNDGKTQLSPSMCIGFPAGKGNAHNLVNETSEDVLYLEVGDRTSEDEAIYPDDDIQAKLINDKWAFTHKNGDPY